MFDQLNRVTSGRKRLHCIVLRCTSTTPVTSESKSRSN